MTALLALLASFAAAQFAPAAVPPSDEAGKLVERARESIRPSLADEDDVYERGRSAGPWSARAPLANLGLVSTGIYRSAQPEQGGYEQAAKLGIRTILNLRKDTRGEPALAAAHGIAVVHVPMRGLRHAPTFEQMDAALAVLRDPSKRPVLIHCAYGKDRTGFVTAAWRVTEEGLSVEDAAQEAERYGCCWWLFGDLRDYLRGYQAHRAK